MKSKIDINQEYNRPRLTLEAENEEERVLLTSFNRGWASGSPPISTHELYNDITKVTLDSPSDRNVCVMSLSYIPKPSINE